LWLKSPAGSADLLCLQCPAAPGPNPPQVVAPRGGSPGGVATECCLDVVWGFVGFFPGRLK